MHTSVGSGRGGALILDRCRAFDLFGSVDAHLWRKGLLAPGVPALQKVQKISAVNYPTFFAGFFCLLGFGSQYRSADPRHFDVDPHTAFPFF
jgi:hypothetical protein